MASINANLRFAQNFAAKHLLNELFRYADTNPDVNFPRLLTLLRRIVPAEKHKRQVTQVLEAYQQNPSIHNYINRFFELDPNIKHRLVFNWFLNAQFMGVPRHLEVERETGVHIPNFILIDPTSACNLRCKGCWAGAYAHHDVLEYALVDRVCREAKEVGIYWIAMSGGEPFLWPHLLRLAEQHDDVAFMIYTNGTLLDDAMTDRLQAVGNISPAISLEGWRESTDARRGAGVFDRITAAMDRLRARRMVFGISLTINRHNVEEVTSDAFIEFLMEKGALYGWSFHYIPIGRDPNPELMVTTEQRVYLAERIHHIRTKIGLQIADFWNDGELAGGCISGGRHYFHITANGAVEPCAFVHVSTHNIKDHALMEILQTPLFKAFQRRQPFSRNLLRACPIIDLPEQLREIIAETHATPTDAGAEAAWTEPIASALDAQAARWKAAADEIWAARHPESVEEAMR